MKLADAWPWNSKNYRMWWFIVPLGLIMAVVFYPMHGLHSLWHLIWSLMGLGMIAVFSFVGKKVFRLRYDNMKRGEAVESYVNIGMLQSAGVAVLSDSELILIPVVGSELTIPLVDIKTIRKAKGLPGKLLIGKASFFLTTATQKRIAFGVTKETGARWEPRLFSTVKKQAPLKG